MTATVIRSGPRTPRSWLPAVNLLAASAAVAVSVTALVIAADDDTAAPLPAPAVVAAADAPVVTEYRCGLRAGSTRC